METDQSQWRKPDLHTHSTASDGVLSPLDLVRRAADRGVDVLALTDHDTLSGFLELSDRSDLGLKLVPGVEISTRFEALEIHVVGLGVDPTNAALMAFLERQHARRWERATAIADKLNRRGISDVFDQVVRASGGGVPGRTHFARVLLERGKVADFQDAFKRYLGKGQSAYVPTPWPGMGEAIAAISGAGGTPVLAHPLAYKLTATRLRRLVDAFCGQGGTAMEVVSGWQNAESTTFLAAMIRARGLLASCGSDFHAPKGRMIDVGAYSAVPKGLELVL